MSDTKEFSDEVWDYATQIGNRHEVMRVQREDRALVPDIVALLESQHSFKCLQTDGGIGEAIRSFASSEPEFTDPTGRKWKPGISGAANCADSPEGWWDALRLMTARLPYSLVLLVDASRCPERFVQLFTSAKYDARLVILE